MAVRTRSSKTLSSCESSIRNKSCRHVDESLGRSKIEEFCAEIGQTEPCAETLDKESKGVKKTKEVMFAIEAIEMEETVKNRLKDARIAKIKNESKVEKLQWMHTMCGFHILQELLEVWKMDHSGTRRDH